ncbi:MAG TPA: nucleotide exchange factor GrpE [Acidimicrobiales bacterium]|nr:nucleotide exchange factor GrpE [Acidimicrobiales bacterium]
MPRTENSVDPRVEPVIDDAALEGDDDAVPEAPNDSVVDDLDDLLFTARRERDEYLDLSRRVQADFENYKKRMIRQQTDNLERAAEDLVTKVLPVLDALDLARAHLGASDDLSDEGKALVAGSTLLADTLNREGLERIGVAGEPFDPTTHEAVDHAPAAETAEGDEAAPVGPVVDEVLRAGYRWKGRVIRPAMVRVRG